ncbi:hypothetical protein ACFFP0_19300 [Rhizobium puerariae]|uniref:Uncharacterized protein n=1 Tax=Rhizobium puerariae TaxID=1585791 RepID=A0ABV6AK58_9HYPH
MTFLMTKDSLMGFERSGSPVHTVFGLRFPITRKSDGYRLAIYFDLIDRTFHPQTDPPEGMGASQDLHADSLEPMMSLLSPEDIAYATREAIEYGKNKGAS